MHVASLVPRTNARNYFLPHTLFYFTQAISADILDRIFVDKSTLSYPHRAQCLKALKKYVRVNRRFTGLVPLGWVVKPCASCDRWTWKQISEWNGSGFRPRKSKISSQSACRNVGLVKTQFTQGRSKDGHVSTFSLSLFSTLTPL